MRWWPFLLVAVLVSALLAIWCGGDFDGDRKWESRPASTATGPSSPSASAGSEEPGDRTLRTSPLGAEADPQQPVHGRIVDDRGRAVASAVCRLCAPELDRVRGEVRSDAEGRFRFPEADVAPGGGGIVHVTHPEHWPTLHRRPEGERSGREILITLARKHFIEGRTTDSEERPIAGVAVRFLPLAAPARAIDWPTDIAEPSYVRILNTRSPPRCQAPMEASGWAPCARAPARWRPSRRAMWCPAPSVAASPTRSWARSASSCVARPMPRCAS